MNPPGGLVLGDLSDSDRQRAEMKPKFVLRCGGRYRRPMRKASDDLLPMHRHRTASN